MTTSRRSFYVSRAVQEELDDEIRPLMPAVTKLAKRHNVTPSSVLRTMKRAVGKKGGQRAGRPRKRAA